MKLFIASLCCLAVLIGGTLFGSAVATRKIDRMLTELHHAPSTLGEVPPEAKAVSDAVLALWEEDFFLISLLHPHAHLDEVKEKMVVFHSYSGTEEYAEWKQAHASLEESLLHLKGLLEANIDNIM